MCRLCLCAWGFVSFRSASLFVFVVGQILVGAMLSMGIKTSTVAWLKAFFATGMLFVMLTNFHIATPTDEMGAFTNQHWGICTPGVHMVTRPCDSFAIIFNTSIDDGARLWALEFPRFFGPFDTLDHQWTLTNHFGAINTGGVDLVTRFGEAIPTFSGFSFATGTQFWAPEVVRNLSRSDVHMEHHMYSLYHTLTAITACRRPGNDATLPRLGASSTH